MKGTSEKSTKFDLSPQQIAALMDRVGDLVDDAEIKLIVSERLSGDLFEQLRLAQAANVLLRKALTILLAQSDSVRNSEEWRYWFDVFDETKYAALNRLAEVEYMMAGNKLPESDEKI